MPLVAAFCCVCGDQASEPAALTEDFDFRTSPDTFLALECVRCGCLYFGLVPGEDAVGQSYPPAYFKRHKKRRVSRPEPGLRVLDLPPHVDGARLADLARGSVRYDLARLDLTLEHAPDPAGILQAVRSALRPGGQLVLILNNLRSPGFSLFKGRHWGAYDPPRQRRLYSVDGLMRLTAGAGLELASVTTVATADTWVRSVHRVCQDWEVPSFLTRRFSDRAWVSVIFFGVLDGLFRVMGRGALLVATLRRPEYLSAP